MTALAVKRIFYFKFDS